MSQHFTSILFAFSSALSWLPPALVSILMLVIVGLTAFYAGHGASALILRIPGTRSGAMIRNTVSALRRPMQIMVTLLTLLAALPAATGFSYEQEQDLRLFFFFLLILVLGFSIITMFRLMSEAYLNRLARLDYADDIMARAHQTQIKVLRRLGEILIGLVTVASALMLFPSVKQYGVSLFASAGAASLIVGLSARGLLTNLIAGVQIAITQPIRMEDLVVINGDWCWVEEITATYVVLRVWDWRRHIVPISYFLENRFENWTHNSAAITGVVFLWLDYDAPMDEIRDMLRDIVRSCPLWDGKVFDAQVSDCTDQAMSVRVIASARNAMQSWDLRCDIREKAIARIRKDFPQALPRRRVAFVSPETGEKLDMADPDTMLSPPVHRPPPGSYMGPGSVSDSRKK
ncbi:mechanosensitive ion channel family protein [Bombella sp. TMW 2.2543]|uniref:Mechanosensitive ion channel family protein n=1 Tax=Bombella pluederhausensis TaxID=2967336 RepID=A0ABT3WFB6_9PROT|nr:mechanosensitive ion channel family protein [Bombella pluederhausensis]MCX5617800.1 mechanosensitive ion channel family protein [Bombella pluederhausensis]